MASRFIAVAAFICAFPLLGQASSLDKELQIQLEKHGQTGPFLHDTPEAFKEQRLIDLGAQLFFSPDLSLDGSVSCASCHHPTTGGADGITLPIGIGGGVSTNIGKERLSAAMEIYGDDSVRGLIPRNTPTVFNASLYRKAMFWDGRAEYARDENGESYIKTGFSISPVSPTYYEQQNLLQTQARMPMVSPFEMKGHISSFKNNLEIQESVVDFLRQSPYWCREFKQVFDGKNCASSITLTHLTRALAAYQASLVFVDSPFNAYVEGDVAAIDEDAKQGALLFFKAKDEGGAGCVACHSGRHLTDEGFHNLGIPSSALGTNGNGWDLGRLNVDTSITRIGFRTPGLLNISTTGPYFHNGSAATLTDAISYHGVKNRESVPLDIVEIPGVDYSAVNRQIQEDYRWNNQLLPEQLSKEQVKYLEAFLLSLTDPCLTDQVCIEGLIEPIVETDRKAIIPEKPKARIRERTVFSKHPRPECKPASNKVKENGKLHFTRLDANSGFEHTRKIGQIKNGWLMDVVNYGSVSATDLNHDCRDDLVFDTGTGPVKVYLQEKDGSFSLVDLKLPDEPGQLTALVVDLDGNYEPDLLVTNLGFGRPYVVFDFLVKPDVLYLEGFSGPMINATFADVDSDGDLDVAFAYWRTYKSFRQDHIWLNDGHGNLSPISSGLTLRQGAEFSMKPLDESERNYDIPMGGNDLTFTPNFADIDNDGDQDLLLAADFFRSQVFINDNGTFVDVTDKEQIDDNNGMGAAVADFTGDGLVDWYVTSINEVTQERLTGNRLYRNTGKGQFVREVEGVRVDENAWSWGSCAKDFDNDGDLDLLYVSGYGEVLESAEYQSARQEELSNGFYNAMTRYSNAEPRLILNDGSGKFVNASKDAGLGHVQNGRAVACFDYQNDGDIDFVIVPVEGEPVLYRNDLDGAQNWLSIRLLGQPGNTEALGAVVTLETEQGNQKRQVRYENNYVSRNPATVHFGLGALKQEDIKRVVVEFPGKPADKLVIDNPDINQLLILQQ